MCSTLPNENRETNVHETGCPILDIEHPSSARLATLRNHHAPNARCEYCGNDKEETAAAVREKVQSPSSYLEQKVFWLLLPALEETFTEASKWNALQLQKCRFNGLDYLAEILWNRNPHRSKKFSPRLSAFDIPLFKQWLHLRPPYPKSWLWSEDEAALHLQRYVRGWLVRKRVDVQEMRKFWKDIVAKNLSSKQTNRTKQQEIDSSGEIQTRLKYGTIDADSVHCKKYRWMIYANRGSDARMKDAL